MFWVETPHCILASGNQCFGGNVLPLSLEWTHCMNTTNILSFQCYKCYQLCLCDLNLEFLPYQIVQALLEKDTCCLHFYVLNTWCTFNEGMKMLSTASSRSLQLWILQENDQIKFLTAQHIQVSSSTFLPTRTTVKKCYYNVPVPHLHIVRNPSSNATWTEPM